MLSRRTVVFLVLVRMRMEWRCQREEKMKALAALAAADRKQ